VSYVPQRRAVASRYSLAVQSRRPSRRSAAGLLASATVTSFFDNGESGDGPDRARLCGRLGRGLVERGERGCACDLAAIPVSVAAVDGAGAGAAGIGRLPPARREGAIGRGRGDRRGSRRTRVPAVGRRRSWADDRPGRPWTGCRHPAVRASRPRSCGFPGRRWRGAGGCADDRSDGAVASMVVRVRHRSRRRRPPTRAGTATGNGSPAPSAPP
jgi:hypothetical protein